MGILGGVLILAVLGLSLVVAVTISWRWRENRRFIQKLKDQGR